MMASLSQNYRNKILPLLMVVVEVVAVVVPVTMEMSDSSS